MADFEIKDNVLVKYNGKGGKVVIPEGVTRIAKDAFGEYQSCWACNPIIESITIPASVVTIDDSFANVITKKFAKEMEEYYDGDYEDIIEDEDIWYMDWYDHVNEFFESYDNLIIHYQGNIAEWCNMSLGYPIVRAKRKLFIHGKQIDGDLIIPDGVTEIHNIVFMGCKDLTSVTIPSSVKKIGDAVFAGCKKLKTIVFKGTEEEWQTVEKPKDWDKAMSKCQIVCSDSEIKEDNKSKKPSEESKGLDISKSTVWGIGKCKDTDIIIPSGVKMIGRNAFNESNIESIVIPEGVTNIECGAFYGCDVLTSVKLSSTVKIIDCDVFRECSSLTTITIPDSVEEISECAFYNCESLKEIVLPNKLSYLAVGLFGGCENLEKIIIPQSVDTILVEAFWNCVKLKNINYEGTKAQWEDIFKEEDCFGSDGKKFKITVHCKDGDVVFNSNEF